MTLKAFDNEKGVLYNDLSIDLITKGKWSDAIMFASLFGNEKDRNQVIGQYIQKHYHPSNPLFAMLMLKTD